MKNIMLVEQIEPRAKDFEQTRRFIDSLLDRETPIRYREATRHRAIPRMHTFPHKESPHI